MYAVMIKPVHGEPSVFGPINDRTYANAYANAYNEAHKFSTSAKATVIRIRPKASLPKI